MLCVLPLLVGKNWRKHFESGGARQASKIIAAHIPHLPFTLHAAKGDAKKMIIFTKGWFRLNFFMRRWCCFLRGWHPPSTRLMWVAHWCKRQHAGGIAYRMLIEEAL